MYTNVAKPTGTPYTNVNTAKPTYDESTFTYDDSTLYYDGFNPAVYTNVAKPTGTPYTNVNKPT